MSDKHLDLAEWEAKHNRKRPASRGRGSRKELERLAAEYMALVRPGERFTVTFDWHAKLNQRNWGIVSLDRKQWVWVDDPDSFRGGRHEWTGVLLEATLRESQDKLLQLIGRARK